jgi:hypothetical protein
MTFFVHLMMLVASGDFGAHAFSATLSRQSHHGFGRSTLLHAGRSEKAIVSVPSDVSKRISFVSSLVTVNDADVNEVGDDNSDGIDDNDDDGDDDVGAAVPDASPELRALLLARNAQFLAGLRLRKEAIDTVLRCKPMDSFGPHRVSFSSCCLLASSLLCSDPRTAALDVEDRWLQLRDSIGMTRATLKRYATQVRWGVAHPRTVNATDQHPCMHFIHVFAPLQPPLTRSTPRWPSTSSSSPSRCLLSLPLPLP